MPRQHKLLPLYVSLELYARLERAGREAERAPEQEARFRLKKSLEACHAEGPAAAPAQQLLEAGDGR